MILPYFMRLGLLCLASFFLLHLALGLTVWLTAPFIASQLSRVKAHLAARLLLTLRLLPACLAALVVVAVCAPSYLWLEPEAPAEQVGWGCLLAALLALAILGESVTRALRSHSRSKRFIRQCEQRGREAGLGGEDTPVWLVEEKSALVALSGILRPRLMISELVLRTLSPEQLAAVLRHERAHRRSRDNLKRLLMLLSPGLLPFWRNFGALERAWAVASEWAADDLAAEGNPRRARTLAFALVRVARLHATRPFPGLATSLLADGAGLSARVDRLLHPAQLRQETQASPILKAAAGLTLAAGMAGLVSQPAMLHSVHELLEDLIR